MRDTPLGGREITYMKLVIGDLRWVFLLWVRPLWNLPAAKRVNLLILIAAAFSMRL